MAFTLSAILWIAFLFFGVARVPALGPLFEVRDGIWQHEDIRLESQNIPGLRKQVVITIDQSGVPHVFAESESDLYLAQGFLIASQRLFQLEIDGRQTAGLLTQMLGPAAFPYDEFFTKLGLRNLTRENWENSRGDEGVAPMVESYVSGVNAYIDRLPQVPPEYKVFGRRPAKYEIASVMHMAEALTWALAGRTFDLQLSKYQQRIGAKKVLDLFPEYLPDAYEDFILPGKFSKPHAPEKPEMFGFVTGLKNIPRFPLPNPGRGSNNWAVSPAKSTTGHSILANDTHLALSLPNVWYENQLSCPDYNVYGVSLVGVPGIINGFNKDIAWGPTNGTTDVLDFFEMEFENGTSWKYKWDGGWEEAHVTMEKIPSKLFGYSEVQVVETKAGMIWYREGKLGLAADWTGYRPGHEIKAIRAQFKAKTAADCIAGFSDWLVPIQNFLCADKNNIGLIHAGFVPKREPGEGRFIMDGRAGVKKLTKAVDKVPQSFNPTQGFILSANQKVVPPGYPDYFGWDYESPFRAIAIREGLLAKQKFSPEDMMALQNDNLDVLARLVLPLMLSRMPGDGNPWIKRLKKWDFRIRSTQPEAAVYKAWWQSLKNGLFEDKLGESSFILLPRDMRIAWMLTRVMKNPNDSDGQWIDNRNTDRFENLDDLIRISFENGLARLRAEQGRDESQWDWKKFDRANIPHVGHLPGFGSEILEVDGSLTGIRGQNGVHGAVYKSVVALGDWPRAWIQVPGGNNGDPFAPDFERYVKDWAKGLMRPVEFYKDVDEAVTKAARVVYLKPEGRP